MNAERSCHGLICLEGLRIASVLAKIQTRHPLNTGQICYHLSQLTQ
jgi:hypothetical protein